MLFSGSPHWSQVCYIEDDLKLQTTCLQLPTSEPLLPTLKGPLKVTLFARSHTGPQPQIPSPQMRLTPEATEGNYLQAGALWLEGIQEGTADLHQEKPSTFVRQMHSFLPLQEPVSSLMPGS